MSHLFNNCNACRGWARKKNNANIMDRINILIYVRYKLINAKKKQIDGNCKTIDNNQSLIRLNK